MLIIYNKTKHFYNYKEDIKMIENQDSKKELSEEENSVSGGYTSTFRGDCDFCNRKDCITIYTSSYRHACVKCYSKICKLNEKYGKDI